MVYVQYVFACPFLECYAALLHRGNVVPSSLMFIYFSKVVRRGQKKMFRAVFLTLSNEKVAACGMSLVGLVPGAISL